MTVKGKAWFIPVFLAGGMTGALTTAFGEAQAVEYDYDSVQVDRICLSVADAAPIMSALQTPLCAALDAQLGLTGDTACTFVKYFKRPKSGIGIRWEQGCAEGKPVLVEAVASVPRAFSIVTAETLEAAMDGGS